jgi:hypothetical protein
MLALLHTPRLPAAAEVVWELLYVWPACIMVADEVSVHTGWLPAWLLASRPCMQALMLRVFMHNTRSLRPELKQRVDGIACQVSSTPSGLLVPWSLVWPCFVVVVQDISDAACCRLAPVPSHGITPREK